MSKRIENLLYIQNVIKLGELKEIFSFGWFMVVENGDGQLVAENGEVGMKP
jgi:hypothetical protein